MIRSTMVIWCGCGSGNQWFESRRGKIDLGYRPLIKLPCLSFKSNSFDICRFMFISMLMVFQMPRFFLFSHWKFSKCYKVQDLSCYFFLLRQTNFFCFTLVCSLFNNLREILTYLGYFRFFLMLCKVLKQHLLSKTNKLNRVSVEKPKQK